MVVVRWAMYLVPFAVFGLLTQLTARIGLDALLGIGVYVLTVLLGLLGVLVMYLAIYAVARRESPLRFLRAARDVLLLAFSTSSSAAVMPVTMRTAEDRLGVSPAIARFVIPLGTTINMAGTALYQVMATLFLAQVYQVDVGLSGLLLVVVLAVGASIGSPGTPGIGIVILAVLLGSSRHPGERHRADHRRGPHPRHEPHHGERDRRPDRLRGARSRRAAAHHISTMSYCSCV